MNEPFVLIAFGKLEQQRGVAASLRSLRTSAAKKGQHIRIVK